MGAGQLEFGQKEVVYRRCGLYDGKPTVAPFWYLELDKPSLTQKPVIVAEME